MQQHSHLNASISKYAGFDRVLCSKTVHGDFDHRQVGIAAEAAALNSDVGSAGRTINRPDRDWFCWLGGIPGFLRCQALECLVRTFGVIPSLVLVKSLLDTTRCRWPQGRPLPQAQRFEEAFDFAIERGRADLTSHMLGA